MRVEVKWASGAFFAEAAEALSIETDRIIAVHSGDEPLVIYTPDADYREPWSATLRADADGIYRIAREPRPEPAMRELLARGLGERDA